MTPTIEIRPLQKSDDRSGFSCGQADLDRFFIYYAGQSQFKLRISTTYVALLNEVIVGYATVTPGVLERATLPDPKMRRRMPAYPLPVLRLARLGISTEAQGLGLGRRLLGHIFRLALIQGDTLGCVGVLTDAKSDALVFYQKYGFERLEGVVEGFLHGEPTPLFLSIQTIASAAEPH